MLPPHIGARDAAGFADLFRLGCHWYRRRGYRESIPLFHPHQCAAHLTVADRLSGQAQVPGNRAGQLSGSQVAGKFSAISGVRANGGPSGATLLTAAVPRRDAWPRCLAPMLGSVPGRGSVESGPLAPVNHGIAEATLPAGASPMETVPAACPRPEEALHPRGLDSRRPRTCLERPG